MSVRDVESLISNASLMRGLTPVELKRLVTEGRMRHIPQGEFFFHQGEDATMLYVLIEGRSKLSQVSADGDQVIVNYFGPGDELGIIVALSNIPYPVSAEAIEACAAIGWHRDQMKALMIECPQLALNGIEMIGRRFARLQRRFQEVATQRVEQRVARALMRLTRQFGRRTPEGVLLDMPLTREDLAQMTGTNLYNVSRILSKWEQSGIIQTSRSRIIMSAVHEMVEIAEDLPIPQSQST